VQTRVVGVVVIEVSLARQAGLLAGPAERGRGGVGALFSYCPVRKARRIGCSIGN